jgi:hypothetical protein
VSSNLTGGSRAAARSRSEARREDGPVTRFGSIIAAGVAQLVEHQLPKLRVAGSSPVSRLTSRFYGISQPVEKYTLKQGSGRGRVQLAVSLPRGVTGNTSDSGSEESRFEPWRGNQGLRAVRLARMGTVWRGG